MRLRRKPGTIEKILSEKRYIIQNPYEYSGHWHEAFLFPRPIILEIGMGGGKFLSTMATRYPEYNYLGIEKKEELLHYALQKIKTRALLNIRLLWFDADAVDDLFHENEIAGLFLNFSDPWPRSRHYKRRLTSAVFLDKYRKIIKPNGFLEFKTDNRDFCEFTINELLNNGWKIEKISLDLHARDFFNGIMTEYEEKFYKLGQNIYYVCAKNNK